MPPRDVLIAMPPLRSAPSFHHRYVMFETGHLLQPNNFSFFLIILQQSPLPHVKRDNYTAKVVVEVDVSGEEEEVDNCVALPAAVQSF